MTEPALHRRLAFHALKLWPIVAGITFIYIGVSQHALMPLLIGVTVSGFGLSQLLTYWGDHSGDICHVCGNTTENGIATCNDCLPVVPSKAYVLECEWCDEQWYSDFRLWNSIQSTIHAFREHPDQLEEEYG